MSIRILLAEDHLIVRDGLKSLLEREGFQVIAEASDGREAVRLAEEAPPDLAIMDLSLPGLNGLEAGRQIMRAAPKIKVIVLTVYKEDSYVLEAMRAGVSGYVLKSQAGAELIQAIREVLRGSVYLSPGVSRTVVDAYRAKTEPPPDPLSPREREVLQLVAEGKTTKEVAAILGTSVKTAESHRTRLMEKLDIHETASLVRYAIRRGIVVP